MKEIMRLSEKGKRHLVIDEGSKTHAYKDTRGTWTVGIGFTELDGRPVTGADVLTVEQIAMYLSKILNQYEMAVNEAITAQMYQCEFDAFVCFCFNIGTSGFRKSSTLEAFNAGNKILAAVNMFEWLNPIELKNRRKADARLFAAGVYLS